MKSILVAVTAVLLSNTFALAECERDERRGIWICEVPPSPATNNRQPTCHSYNGEDGQVLVCDGPIGQEKVRAVDVVTPRNCWRTRDRKNQPLYVCR